MDEKDEPVCATGPSHTFPCSDLHHEATTNTRSELELIRNLQITIDNLIFFQTDINPFIRDGKGMRSFAGLLKGSILTRRK